MHSGHFLVVGSAGAGALRIRATSALIGVTTKKYTAAATSRNEIRAFKNSPYRKVLPLSVNLSAEKSGPEGATEFSPPLQRWEKWES